MKITTMKFSQIAGVVNNKELSLDLFEPQALFQEEGKKGKTQRNVERTRRRVSKSKTNVVQEWPQDNPSPSPIRRKPAPAPKDLIYHLQESLLSYLECISSQQKKSIRMEIDLLLSITNQPSPRILFQQLQRLQLQLSRRVRNRIMHLIFYLLYNQLKLYSQHSIERQIRNYIFCEYYSRKFNFKRLALALCIELQDMYCKVNNYEMSRHYARKALRLAVVMGDHYFQSKMIESLYILNYYEGRLNQNTASCLTKEERRRILETYSEQQECPNIFQQEGGVNLQLKGKQFHLQHHNNYIQNSIPNQNIRYFQNNYHQIIKSIPGKHINVRNIMTKVSSVGTVRKYFGKDNYITLKPQCHIIKPIYQEQVLITHKKEANNSERILGLKRAVKRIRKMLEHIISAYTYHI